MNQKGQTGILVLAGAVLLIALAGGIFFMGRVTAPKPSTPAVTSQTPQPTSTSSPSDVNLAPTGAGETANWNVFTSEYFGFSHKYPSSWVNDNFCYQCTAQPIKDDSNERYLHPQETKYPEGITYIIEDKKFSISFNDWKELQQKEQATDKTRSISHISVDGYRGIRIEGLSEEGEKLNYAIFENKNYIFRISAHKGYSDVLDQMISTFKFTN